MTADPRHGIACGGNWTVDQIKVIGHYPQENSITSILNVSQGGGGCGHNVVLSLAKIDASLPIHALGVLGNDAFGDYLVSECRRFPNVNVEQLRRTGLDATSYTDVFTDQASGRRTFFFYPGANRLFEPAHIDLENLPIKILHMGYLLLMPAMDQPDADFGTVAARFLARVRSQGIRTSIDLVSEDSNRFRHIVPPALKFTDYCIINDWEAERLTWNHLAGGGQIAS